jgi:hypothetical protein
VNLLHHLPEALLHRPHQSLTEAESLEQLDQVLALIDQVMQTDNERQEQPEFYDLDPRPGHILLRNQLPGSKGKSGPRHLEEAEAHFQGNLDLGTLECKFRRFSGQGSLVRVESLKANIRPQQVEVFRHVWKEVEGDRFSYHFIDRQDWQRSYRKSIP